LIEISKNPIDVLTDNQRIFLHGVVNLNLRNLFLDFDLDQVLANSEIPIIEYCSRDLGVNYIGRKLNGYNTISSWIVSDGIMNNLEAVLYETKLWERPDLVNLAPPNEILRAFSYAASLRGIPQSITTSRAPGLADVTHAWVLNYFPWIDVVNQRTDKTLKGEEYKAKKVAEAFKINSGTVHFDDSMGAIRKITEIVREIGIIGFPFPRDIDNVPGMASDEHVFCLVAILKNCFITVSHNLIDTLLYISIN
jgi:hypothetical protein